LQEFLLPLEIINFDNEDAFAYGRVRSDLEKAGNLIGSMDMLIASQSLAKDLILVTNNIREFERIKDLKLENWI
jgi:tRNA(fMet)-specific endonuclease VapC